MIIVKHSDVLPFCLIDSGASKRVPVKSGIDTACKLYHIYYEDSIAFSLLIQLAGEKNSAAGD